jgi:hypothetical protein
VQPAERSYSNPLLLLQCRYYLNPKKALSEEPFTYSMDSRQHPTLQTSDLPPATS